MKKDHAIGGKGVTVKKATGGKDGGEKSRGGSRGSNRSGGGRGGSGPWGSGSGGGWGSGSNGYGSGGPWDSSVGNGWGQGGWGDQYSSGNNSDYFLFSLASFREINRFMLSSVIMKALLCSVSTLIIGS